MCDPFRFNKKLFKQQQKKKQENNVKKNENFHKRENEKSIFYSPFFYTINSIDIISYIRFI